MPYIDTSVLAAYYCPEPLSDKAEKVLRAGPDIFISDLTEVELASAVSRKVREKEIGASDANKIFNQFQYHVAQQLYHYLPIDSSHFQMAREWISGFTTPLRTLDGLHLALAASNNTALITADQQLAQSAEYFGINVQLLN